MLRLPMQGMGRIRHVTLAAQKSCVLGEEQFQSLLAAQKYIKSFPFLETRLWSQNSKTIWQDHNTPLEADTSNQRATQIVFSKVAGGEGPRPSLCNNLKDCIPFCSRAAAEGGVEGAFSFTSPKAGSLGIAPVQPRRSLNPTLLLSHRLF